MSDLKTQPLSERVIVPMSKALLGDIKDYWHERKLDSRSEAIRRLIQAGLEAERRASSPGPSR